MTSEPLPSARVEEDIVPFWNRLGEIASYPAHPKALTTIVALSVSEFVVGYLPLGFIGFLLSLVIWVALYKYAFQCLRDSANGLLEPPEIALNVSDELGRKQILLQLAFILVALVLFYIGGAGARLIGLLVLGFFYPAATMTLAMDENLPNALNPGQWIAILMRFGRPYLAAATLCFVVFLSQGYAQTFVALILPGFLAKLAAIFISDYAIVATFHLMGYLIYQYHDEVGYEPTTHSEPMRRIASTPDQPLLDEASVLARDGKPEAAADLLREEIQSRGGSDAMHTHYRKLLGALGRRDEQLRHGQEWIAALIAQDNERRAVDVARECLDLDPAFQPANPDDVSRIARKAVDLGMTQIALKLLSTYLKANPRHRDVPGNALLAAKMLAERMGKDDVARKLLDQIAERFPNDALAGDIAAYRAFLAKLAVKPDGASAR
jgi:tetratricopeptide (TPR) repeat protein